MTVDPNLWQHLCQLAIQLRQLLETFDTPARTMIFCIYHSLYWYSILYNWQTSDLSIKNDGPTSTGLCIQFFDNILAVDNIETKMPFVGDLIEVYWTSEYQFYPGLGFSVADKFHTVNYDDGDQKKLTIQNDKCRFGNMPNTSSFFSGFNLRSSRKDLSNTMFQCLPINNF